MSVKASAGLGGNATTDFHGAELVPQAGPSDVTLGPDSERIEVLDSWHVTPEDLQFVSNKTYERGSHVCPISFDQMQEIMRNGGRLYVIKDKGVIKAFMLSEPFEKYPGTDRDLLLLRAEYSEDADAIGLVYTQLLAKAIEANLDSYLIMDTNERVAQRIAIDYGFKEIPDKSRLSIKVFMHYMRYHPWFALKGFLPSKEEDVIYSILVHEPTDS